MFEIYNYFNGEEYDEDNIETIPDIFDDVIAFEISRVGAMGGEGYLLLITENGKAYPVLCAIPMKELTKAFYYVDKKMNNMLSTLFLPRKEFIDREKWEFIKTPLNHADGWSAAENGIGWFISAKNEYFNRLPRREFKGNDFVTDDMIFKFPTLIKEILKNDLMSKFPTLIKEIINENK